MPGVLILGTGGHAKVALEILVASGVEVQGFLDDDVSKHGSTVLGYPILGSLQSSETLSHSGVALGIGSNSVRKKLTESLSVDTWLNLVHPSATVSRFATIGRGVMVGMGACIQPSVELGDFCIVNTSASVDHDCRIGAYAHVSVGAHLAGSVLVGEGALIGAGSVARPGIQIGDWTTVGAGAAVVKDIPENETWTGVPARPNA